jgi:hypothetical protein
MKCEVLLNTAECEAPPQGAGSIRTRCYACGNPACKQCSHVMPWYGRRRRVCADCEEDEGKMMLERGERRGGWDSEAVVRSVCPDHSDHHLEEDGSLWAYCGATPLLSEFPARDVLSALKKAFRTARPSR